MSNRTLPPLTIQLMKAKEIIGTEDKWCQHSRHNTRGQRCALGALDAVLGRMVDLEEPIVQLLAGEAHRIYTYRGQWASSAHRVAETNNTSTHTEVMDWFDRAIAKSSADAKAEVVCG